MNSWTVIVDDDCGTSRAYYVEAPTPNAAAAFAERIYDAHTSIGGKVQYVIAGRADLKSSNLNKAPEIIDLMLTAEEAALV